MNDSKRYKALSALVNTHGDNTYIGFGNPESNLLILGKECAKKFNEDDEIIDGFSVQRNSKQWKKFISNPYADITLWEIVPKDQMEDFFNPRFAFRGQQYHCRRKKLDQNGKEIDNKGTSRTWYFYQKLINLIRGNNEMKYGDMLDFQDYCFISDLSSRSKPMSNIGDRNQTVDSVAQRSAVLSTEPFFQAFPVVVGAFGNYMTREQLQQLFPQSRVIVSRQLSMNFTTDYLVGLAKEIADALNKSGVSL